MHDESGRTPVIKLQTPCFIELNFVLIITSTVLLKKTADIASLRIRRRTKHESSKAIYVLRILAFSKLVSYVSYKSIGESYIYYGKKPSR